MEDLILKISITKNPDGSWKMRSDKVRMQVYTSNGYNPNQMTSDSGLSKVATRGFMGTLKDWRDVEITGYVKLNQFSENDNFVWYSREEDILIRITAKARHIREICFTTARPSFRKNSGM